MEEPADVVQWVPEAKALDLCDVPRATWTSWERHGLVVRPRGGAYVLDDVIRIALIAQLRKHLGLDEVAAAIRALDRDGVVEEVVEVVRTLQEGDRLDLVIEEKTAKVTLARNDTDLVRAVRHPTAPRAVTVISPCDELSRVVSGFRNRAIVGVPPATRRRGRPRSSADVLPIRRSA